MTLNDERQQYGNLDEASAVARTPRSALLSGVVIISRFLEKTDEAKAFRRKLLRRPITLRGDTSPICLARWSFDIWKR